MIYRSYILRAVPLIVKAQKPLNLVPRPATRFTKQMTPHRFRDLVLQQAKTPSIEDCLRLLVSAVAPELAPDRSIFREAISDLVKRVLSAQLSKFDAKLLCRFIDGSSELNSLSSKQMVEIFRMVKSRHVNQDPVNVLRNDRWDKCILSLWAASLWHGFPTAQFHDISLSLLKDQQIDWPTLSRLAWCVENDPVTKVDPSITNRVSDMMQSRIEDMSINHLADITKCSSIRHDEYSVARKYVLQRITSQVTSPDQLNLDTRIPSQLLHAWISGYASPQNSELFSSTISACLSLASKDTHLVLEALSEFGIPEWLDESILRSSIIGDWSPSRDQLTSMCMSFAALGMNDLESTSFMAREIERLLAAQSSIDDQWKIGAWFSFVQLTASETTLSALNDAFKDLTATIASGMWDNQGRFVRKELRLKQLAPAERSMRKVISESLSSLGIANMQNVHVVNTPFIAPMYLPDQDLVIVFHEADAKVMRPIVEARGFRVALFNLPEWEQKYMGQSQDDFLASLLSAIQPS